MNVCALLAPYDSGHHRQRMGLGPEHLWKAIEPLLTGRGHAVRAETVALSERFLTEITTAFGVARAIAERVRACRREGWMPLVLSGNCCASLGTVSGCGCDTSGVVWFDAHGEATTPDTTRSGFLDGMGISMLTGQSWHHLARSVPGFTPLAGRQIVLVGARDVEPDETDLLQRVGVQRLSRAEDLALAVAALQSQSALDGVYVHLDLDVLDPQEATANPWTPPGGLRVAPMARALTEVRQILPIKALGIASFSPEIDSDHRGLRAALRLIEAVS